LILRVLFLLSVSTLFNPHIFGVFQLYFLFVPLWSKSRHCVLSSLLNLFGCALWMGRWPVLVVVHVHLGRMCSILLEAVIYWHQLHALEPNFCWIELCHYWLYAWWVCPLWEWIVEVSSCACGFIFFLHF
jgi:hypothetical protein